MLRLSVFLLTWILALGTLNAEPGIKITCKDSDKFKPRLMRENCRDALVKFYYQAESGGTYTFRAKSNRHTVGTCQVTLSTTMSPQAASGNYVVPSLKTITALHSGITRCQGAPFIAEFEDKKATVAVEGDYPSS